MMGEEKKQTPPELSLWRGFYLNNLVSTNKTDTSL